MNRMNFRTVDVSDLPQRYVEPLKELTIPGFLMKGMFEECLSARAGRVIVAFSNTTPVGWCLLTPYGVPVGKLLAAFFVHEDYRRLGIGRYLADLARKGDEPIEFRASDRNRGFFEAVGLLEGRPLASV